MTDAIGYACRSKDSDQSLARQRQRITAYCDDHEYHLQTVFEDDITSASDERPAYERAISSVLTDQLNCIVFSGLHQLGRDVDAVLRTVSACRRAGVELHTVDDGRVDLSKPVQTVLTILGATPRQTDRLRRVEDALLELRDRQERPTGLGQPRFGMEYDESTPPVQVPGDRFEDVLTILEMHDRGESYPEIADAVGISKSQAYRVVQRREWYYERADAAEQLDTE